MVAHWTHPFLMDLPSADVQFPHHAPGLSQGQTVKTNHERYSALARHTDGKYRHVFEGVLGIAECQSIKTSLHLRFQEDKMGLIFP